ncbi:myelin-oligodendrocyte glycoprotein-like isoform X2 [Anabas testudineus]|uniref:myelin-oligodendrocyte glycoprotein-like isoform X2 n=1 Tax=Anabas testudineus TaxID=64144 RepID=UPI00143D5466|nr:myelin-oligodendrocyte glycoprotein-like isoform X2 [Anabas testudineus]
MAAITSSSAWWTLLFLCLPVSASQNQINITANLGDRVILPCNTSSKYGALEWSRVGMNDSVYLYKDGQLYKEGQDPSYKNRVELMNGSLSVIISDVRINDTGTYECLVAPKSRRNLQSKTLQLINTINLTVEPGNNKDEGDKRTGHIGLISVLVAVVVVGFVI